MVTKKVTTPKDGEKKKISIALQGGGSHGAFAWGVLDRLLEDGRFDIRGMSGTSAGGMNAAATIMGLLKNGNEGARETLHAYWHTMHKLSKEISPYAINPYDKEAGNFNLNHTPAHKVLSFLNKIFSPYDLNPYGFNPFHDFVHDFFDFHVIREHANPRLFLAATQVKSGKIKIFSNEHITSEVLMASACLPFLFHAVRIDGDYYWDGGYIANPAIYPLINDTDAKDIVLVQLTKTHCDKLPRTEGEITERFKEITYNGCLVREMRAIYLITKLIDQGIIPQDKMKRINMHVIKNEESFKDLNLSSALNTDWDFLIYLRDEGRKTAEKWIQENYDSVGVKNTFDQAMFDDFVG